MGEWFALRIDDMGFLLRTAFWLGLTFSAMDWPAGAPAVPTAGAVAAQAGKICVEAPQVCLKAATAIGSANAGVESATRPLKRRSDTLEGADRAPVWRGRS